MKLYDEIQKLKEQKRDYKPWRAGNPFRPTITQT